MANNINPYLTFDGNARAAMEFYKSVFGGELKLQSFKEMNASQNPDHDNLIMHSELTTADGMTLMGSDDPDPNGAIYGSSIALTGENEASLKGYWDKLVEGATILAPFETAP